MISIVICSRNKFLNNAFLTNIQKTIGCEYELITIDNSESKYSIFSAYNLGIKKSHYKNICLVHEDVKFVTTNWGKKLLDNLELPNVGLLGVAGGKAVLRVPFGWSAYEPVFNISQVSLKNKKTGIESNTSQFNPTSNKPQSVVLLDGVLLFGRKDIFNQCHFDETIGGFHGYDMDICLNVYNNGFKNYVIFDMDIIHFSKGNFNKEYIDTLFKIHNKWKNILPVFDETCNLTRGKLYKAEKRVLHRLRKRMVRAGISFDKISPVYRDYTLLIGRFWDKFTLVFLPIELIVIKFISINRKLMNYQKQQKHTNLKL